MKKCHITSILIAAALFLTSNITAAPTEEEALKDWNALQKSYDDTKKELDGTVPDYAPNIIGTDYAKVFTVLDKFNNNESKLQKQLSDFSKKYGDNTAKINESISSIVKIDWKSGKHPTTTAGETYEKLKKLLDNVQQAKLSKSADLVQEAENLQRVIDMYEGQANQKNYDQLKSTLEFALKFDPKNEKAKEMLDSIDKKRKEKFDAFDKKIDNAKWPGNYKSFAGPGNPNKLSATALEYFQNSKDWGSNEKNPSHCVAVAIRGDWGSHKKNLLGQTIQWYLPVYLAIYSDKAKDKSVVQVFSLSLLTQEEQGIKKAPPFTGVTVGDSWKMRRENLPSGGSAGSTGLIGTLFWIGLAFGNIVAGMLAAAPLLKQKLPQLNKVYEKLTPLSNIIGVIVLAIGALSLLGAVLQLFLLRFVIFSNILPQIAAIAVGLFLGKELLLKKPNLSDKAGEAAEKAQELLRKYDDKIKLLEMYQIPLGLSCIVIGLLHLLISNAPLF